MTTSGQRIFVSHSHLDNEFGTRLAQDLRLVLAEDSAVFYDVMGGLHGGERWWEKILKELTARDVFLLILSPDAMNSVWVRREIDIALNKNKDILPVLHRSCDIRADLEILQIISFLAPKRYEAAFQEVLLALHLPLDTAIVPEKPKIQRRDPAAALIQRMETAFTEQDWPDVIRKADYLMKHMPESMTSLVYRWQGVALREEGKEQQAQEAFETALALVSDRQQRLTLLSDYTALLVRQQQWVQVLQRSKEALRLVPHDPAWQAMQQQAQDQLAPQIPPTPPPQKQEQIKDKEPTSIPQKTRDQWFNEGSALRNLKRYEEALRAYEQVIHLDPNFADAYNNKGIALYALKRYEEALRAYEQVIRLDPNFAAAYYNKGKALNELKRCEEALRALDQAIQLNPNSADAYRVQAYAYRNLMQYELASEANRRANELDPTVQKDAIANEGIGGNTTTYKQNQRSTTNNQTNVPFLRNLTRVFRPTRGKAQESTKTFRKSAEKILAVAIVGIIILAAISLFALYTPHSTAPASTVTPASTVKAAADKQVLVLPEAGVTDIASFDPALATDVPSVTAINMVFTGLVEVDNNGNVAPYLASSWDVSSDNLTYTFHLRPGLKFSDGTPLTSADVAYSIDRALQPATQSGTGPYYLRYIKDALALNSGKIKTIIGDSIKTTDANTISITASEPEAFFLDALTYPCSYVVEKSLIDQYGATGWTDHLTAGGGDGPFKVQEYVHSKQIVFVPNPNYWGAQPQLKKVIFPFYEYADTTYQAYLSNQLDEGSIPIVDYPSASKRVDFVSIPQLWINYYAMNYNVKPFDNIDIRQAFELAINKDSLVKSVWKNSLIPTNHIVPEGMPGYTPNLTGPAGSGTQGNQAMAKTLFAIGMQQEGWTNVFQIPTITLKYSSGNQDVTNEVSILQQDWQAVLGVSVKAEAIDFHKLLTDITANTLQFWGIAWVADYPDPQDWLTLQFDKGSGNNNMNYGQNHSSDAAAQQQIQTQLEAADVNQNRTARLQAYMTAEQSLVNDVAWLPMEQVSAFFLLKPCVVGFVVNNQDVTPPQDWGNTYISTDSRCATV